MTVAKTIRFDHQPTPAALRLVTDVEAREKRRAAKANRVQALKEADARVKARREANS